MSTRRKFLRTGVGAMAGAAMLSSHRFAMAQTGPPPATPPLTPFIDPLPLPSRHTPTGTSTIVPDGYSDAVQTTNYEVVMREASHRWHSQLPPGRIWGYSGVFPGPSFEVRSGQPITVKFHNLLPSRHLYGYAIDPTLHGAQPGFPEVRTNVHLHGAKVLPDSDGHPDAWFTQDFAEHGHFFARDWNYYPNDQPAASLWYHDHTIGITRLNVVAGLAGFYFIRDEAEDALNLPKGDYEIPLVVQDKVFLPDGSVAYPAFGITADHPLWQPDFYGDVPVVNGKIRPFLEVEPKKYRFRVLNASNSRYFRMYMEGAGAAPFIHIGGDQGFIPAPVPMGVVLIGPGERADIIIDFSSLNGKDLVITNDAPTPFGEGIFLPVPVPPPPSPIMQFRVRQKNTNPDTSVIPNRLPARTPLDISQSVLTRDIVMTERTDSILSPKILLLENKMYEEPVGTFPKAGSTEIWRFINGVVGAHPQHLHLAELQVIDRQPFDPNAFYLTGRVAFTGDAVPPEPNEVNARKDTVNVYSNTVTRVLANFEMPRGAKISSGQRFQYVHHCHILEHEDNEMMRPFEVIG